jgi:hypothetical protein
MAKLAESLATQITDYFDDNRVLYPNVQCPSIDEIRDYLLRQDDVENSDTYQVKTAEALKRNIKKHGKLILG